VNSRRRNLRNAGAPHPPTPTGVERTWHDHRAGITPFDPLRVVGRRGRLARRFRLRLFTFVPVRNARDSVLANCARLLRAACPRPTFSQLLLPGPSPDFGRNTPWHGVDLALVPTMSWPREPRRRRSGKTMWTVCAFAHYGSNRARQNEDVSLRTGGTTQKRGHPGPDCNRTLSRAL